MPTIWNCPYCDRETYKELPSCPHCKLKFNKPWFCENCRQDNPVTAQECLSCGKSIKQANPGQWLVEEEIVEKDPLSFLGPEHDLAMLQMKKKSKEKPEEETSFLFKKLRNWFLSAIK